MPGDGRREGEGHRDSQGERNVTRHEMSFSEPTEGEMTPDRPSSLISYFIHFPEKATLELGGTPLVDRLPR